MKKLKLNFLEIAEESILSREEMKGLIGGGVCGVLMNGEWRSINPGADGTTRSTAISYVNNGYASAWCCDSCSHW